MELSSNVATKDEYDKLLQQQEQRYDELYKNYERNWAKMLALEERVDALAERLLYTSVALAALMCIGFVGFLLRG